MLSKKKYVRRLYNKYSLQREQDTRISKRELSEIKRIYYWALFLSAIIGVAFILLLFLPIHRYPSFFNDAIINIKLLGWDFKIRWIRELDNFILTYIEVYILSILSVNMIQKLAAILDFPSTHSKHYQLHFENIELLSLEKKQKKEKELGLNPYEGLPKIQLFVYWVLSKYKALLSNLLLKYLLQSYASRYLLKLFIDLAGAPIYAFWNAYSTAKLYNAAKYYIFSVELTDYITEKLNEESSFKPFIERELQNLLVIIVTLKREFSETNHYYSSRLIETLNVTLENTQSERKSLKAVIEKSGETHINWVLLLFATGVILDGSISRRELKTIKTQIKNLGTDAGILNKIEEYLHAYKNGQGVDFIRAHYLP
jgi:hypothetical protein